MQELELEVQNTGLLWLTKFTPRLPSPADPAPRLNLYLRVPLAST
jgi:hypothetical protein